MAVMWAADTPLTTRTVRERLNHPCPVTHGSVGHTLLALYRKGYLARDRRDRRSWQYGPARPLAEHLAVFIQRLVAASPNRPLTLRLALAVESAQPPALAGADLATLRHFAAAVLEKRDGFRYTAGICQRAAEDVTGDEGCAGRCRARAAALASAAEDIDEALAAATGRWDQFGAGGPLG
ncbi:MAG TPA: BlaI/MecI/CopY family transcriptional regulator [Streptosporangiaceae bacterium]|nr:BlaI/MecI/CopY family transcriptional regulator [Streptosporangiaceae bacterium]